MQQGLASLASPIRPFALGQRVPCTRHMPAEGGQWSMSEVVLGEVLTLPVCSACEQFACFVCEASLFGRGPRQATDTPPLNRQHEVLLPEPGVFIGKGAEVRSSPVLSRQPGGLEQVLPPPPGLGCLRWEVGFTSRCARQQGLESRLEGSVRSVCARGSARVPSAIVRLIENCPHDAGATMENEFRIGGNHSKKCGLNSHPGSRSIPTKLQLKSVQIRLPVPPVCHQGKGSPVNIPSLQVREVWTGLDRHVGVGTAGVSPERFSPWKPCLRAPPDVV